MILHRLLTFITLLIAVTLSAEAQLRPAQRGQIYGYVLDEEGRALEYVNIAIAGTTKGVVSSATGFYQLSVSTTDSTHIIFSSLGYRKTARTIPPLRGELFLQVKMQPESTELAEVTISTQRRQLTSMQTIETPRIKLVPDAAGGSIESLLVTLPGVSSNNELSSQYSVRGGNFDENSVYINGIEVYRPLLIRAGQQEGLSIINPDMVQSVNFSSGGFDAKYSDKMASVLDIHYRKPTTFEASLSASLMGATAYVGSQHGGFTQIHGLRFKRNNTLLATLDTKGEYDPTYIDYQTYLTYTLSPQWELSFLGNISQNDFNFRPTDRSTSFGTYNMVKNFTVFFEGAEKDRFQTLFGALSTSWKPSLEHAVTWLNSAFVTNENETYDILGQYWLKDVNGTDDDQLPPVTNAAGIGTYMEHARNRLQAQVYASSLQGKHQLQKHKLEWGATLQFEQIKDKINEWEMRDSAGYSLPHNPNTVEMIYALRSRQHTQSIRLSTYMQDAYRAVLPSGIWLFTAGARLSYWTFNDELLFSPRASVAFIPSRNQDLTFRLAGGLYYQSPFYKEFRQSTYHNGSYNVTLNHNIRSQQSIQIVGGTDWVFRAIERPFKLTVESYYKKLNNLIPYTVDNVRVRYYGDNLSHGYATGIDMKLFGEFVPGVDSWFSFSLMKTEELLNGKWVPRPTDQRYNFSVYFQDYFPGINNLRVHLKAIWADGLPVTAPRRGMDEVSFRTPPYRRIDLGLTYELRAGEGKLMRLPFFKPFKRIFIGIDAFNLLELMNVNSYYWVTDFNNQQYGVSNYLTGRQFNFKISADF